MSPETVHTTSATPPTIDAICKQIDAVGVTAMNLIEELQAQRDALKDALSRMLALHDTTVCDSEGLWPEPDSGCLECTCGTVPNTHNTGLCAYHHAKKLFGIL